MTEGTFQRKDLDADENIGPIQYKQAPLCSLRNLLALVKSKVSAAQRRYKSSFDRSVSFCPVISPGFVYVGRPSRPLTEAGKQKTGRL